MGVAEPVGVEDEVEDYECCYYGVSDSIFQAEAKMEIIIFVHNVSLRLLSSL